MPRRRRNGGTGAAYGYVPVARRKAVYELVAEVSSSKDPSRKWKVKRNVETGALSCSCPRWIFNPEEGPKGERWCKHIQAYVDDVEAGLVDKQATIVDAAVAAGAVRPAIGPRSARARAKAEAAKAAQAEVARKVAAERAARLKREQALADALRLQRVATVVDEWGLNIVRKVGEAMLAELRAAGWQLTPVGAGEAAPEATQERLPGMLVAARTVRRIVLDED